MGFSFLLVLLILDMMLTTLKPGMVMINLLDILSMFVWALMTFIVHIDIICTRLAFYQTFCKMFLLFVLLATIIFVSQILISILFLWSPKVKRLLSLSVLPKTAELSTDPTKQTVTSGSRVTWTSATAEEKEIITTMFQPCFSHTLWAAGVLAT